MKFIIHLLFWFYLFLKINHYKKEFKAIKIYNKLRDRFLEGI